LHSVQQEGIRGDFRFENQITAADTLCLPHFQTVISLYSYLNSFIHKANSAHPEKLIRGASNSFIFMFQKFDLHYNSLFFIFLHISIFIISVSSISLFYTLSPHKQQFC